MCGPQQSCRFQTCHSIDPRNGGNKSVNHDLDTAYHVVLEGGKLILRVKNSDDNQLLPQFSDAFTDASMSLIIRFTRNKQNRVSGLALSFAHVRKLGATKI